MDPFHERMVASNLSKRKDDRLKGIHFHIHLRTFMNRLYEVGPGAIRSHQRFLVVKLITVAIHQRLAYTTAMDRIFLRTPRRPLNPIPLVIIHRHTMSSVDLCFRINTVIPCHRVHSIHHLISGAHLPSLSSIFETSSLPTVSTSNLHPFPLFYFKVSDL